MEKEAVSKIIRIKIENFQSHENTVLGFEDGLNVIVGPSDQGKSAVIRALKWVLYNEPRGLDFIRHGSTTARVTLEMSTGYRIVRERSKSKNKYSVIDPDGAEAVFEGFGNDIPKEVINAHGIPKVMLDSDLSSSLNIGEQLEGPFLLSETGSTRAKAIGRLTGTHIIDNAIRDSMTDLRRENQTSDRLEKELQGIDIRLEGYKELDAIKERLEAADTILAKLQLKMDRLHNLEKIVESLEMLKTEFHRTDSIVEKLQGVEEGEDIVKKCLERIHGLKVVSKLDSDYKELCVQLEKSNRIMNKTINIDNCEKLLNSTQVAKEKFSKLIQLNVSSKSVAKEKIRAEEILESTKKTEELLKNIRTAEQLYKKYNTLLTIKERHEANKKEIMKIEKYTEKYKVIDQGVQAIDVLEKSLERLGKLMEVRDQYAVINNYIDEGAKYTENNKQQIRKLASDYAQILKKAGKCPTCGSEISGMKVEEILKHYEEETIC